MKVLGLGKSSFLATSQGGMIELMIGLEHPELVDRMAVISSTARVNDTMRSSIGRWVEWSKAGNMKALIDDIGEKLYTKNFVDNYYPAEALLKTSQEDMERFIIQCEASPDFDIYDRLGEIKFPVLVAGPEVDDVTSADAAAEIAEKLGCPHHTFPGYKHSFYDECPELYDLYREFFLG